MYSSPLHKWTIVNSDLVALRANILEDIQRLRREGLTAIQDGLARQYGRLYRPVALKNYRETHGATPMEFMDGCSNMVSIVFPPNVHLADQFLAESNLDGFQNRVFYTGPDQFESCTSTILDCPREVKSSLDDLTEAAQTYYNLSKLISSNTNTNAGAASVEILADSTRLESKSSVGWERRIEIHFVKRDRTSFTKDQYGSVMKKVGIFQKKYSGVTFKVGFLSRWLGEILVIQVQTTQSMQQEQEQEQHSAHRTADLIQSINLIKGIIFARRTDYVCWMRINS